MNGNIANVQGNALPDDVVITVIIEDVSMAVAPSNVYGVQIIHTDGEQFPIPNEIEYDPGDIDQRFNFLYRQVSKMDLESCCSFRIQSIQ